MKNEASINPLSGDKPFLSALAGQKTARPPFWLMRQAGRYLPEYRAVREKAGGFLNMVYNPALATEVTLQPLRRFGMDAAILFSDILIVPHALGCDLRFAAGEGPVLSPVTAENIPDFDAGAFDETAGPVYDSVAGIAKGLVAEGFSDAALIGFAGSPWTVACYMAEGGGSRDFLTVKSWAYRDPQNFARLIDVLVASTIHYLSRQVDAGAEALQLFDSWSGVLDEPQFRQWVIAPTQKIVAALKTKYPAVPLIGFPRGAGVMSETYLRETGVDAIGIDSALPVSWAAEKLQPHKTVQGNLDPMALLAGGAAMEAEITRILKALGQEPFIFNLGHGIHKDTDPAHVEALSKIVKGWQG